MARELQTQARQIESLVQTLDEARAMAVDLLKGYLELMQERGKPIPASDASASPVREPLTVKLRMA